MATPAHDLVAELRRAALALAAADALHAELGITAPMRAVLEALDDRPRTVPQIAGAKRVSRQHIQATVNALQAAGLAEARGNWRHRRSHLVAATARGREVFAEMRRREAGLLAELAAEIGAERLAMAAATLGELAGLLEHPDTAAQAAVVATSADRGIAKARRQLSGGLRPPPGQE